MKKYCSYHEGYHDADDFVVLPRGRGGRTKVAMCGPCYRARQDPVKFKARLEERVLENKSKNKREFAAVFHNKNKEL